MSQINQSSTGVHLPTTLCEQQPPSISLRPHSRASFHVTHSNVIRVCHRQCLCFGVCSSWAWSSPAL